MAGGRLYGYIDKREDAPVPGQQKRKAKRDDSERISAIERTVVLPCISHIGIGHPLMSENRGEDGNGRWAQSPRQNSRQCQPEPRVDIHGGLALPLDSGGTKEDTSGCPPASSQVEVICSAPTHLQGRSDSSPAPDPRSGTTHFNPVNQDTGGNLECSLIHATGGAPFEEETSVRQAGASLGFCRRGADKGADNHEAVRPRA